MYPLVNNSFLYLLFLIFICFYVIFNLETHIYTAMTLTLYSFIALHCVDIPVCFLPLSSLLSLVIYIFLVKTNTSTVSNFVYVNTF